MPSPFRNHLGDVALFGLRLGGLRRGGGRVCDHSGKLALYGICPYTRVREVIDDGGEGEAY